MRQHRSKPRCCTVCHAQTGLFLCTACAQELRELLIGSPKGELRGQPGITWYIARLREQAYGQSKSGAQSWARGTRSGYALLPDERATQLLSRIRGTLEDWNADLDRLSATLSDEQPVSGMAMARRLANRSRELRRHPFSYRLHADLLQYAMQAWRIINRPPDICCGPCPTSIGGEDKDEIYCGTLLYAEARASVVQCPVCRVRYDVCELRNVLRDKVIDMLFTGPELLRLMETRLNDRMPRATFYKLVNDERLSPRSIADDGTRFYTYSDVCEVREKMNEKPCLTKESKRVKSA